MNSKLRIFLDVDDLGEVHKLEVILENLSDDDNSGFGDEI